jgi:putative phage-type endonuclease
MPDINNDCFTLSKYIDDFLKWDIKKLKVCLIDIYKYREEELIYLPTIIKDILQVDVLRNLPLIPQRSKEWFDLRMNRLTASDLAQALGKGKFGNRKQLLEKKAFPETVVFNSFMAPLKWGVMFEEMGMRCYQQSVNSVKLYEFGLIPNNEIKCFGASPDGITETGIMVEMKCPYKRKCTNDVPEQYYLQIQGQLATCNLSNCDYVECYFEAYNDMCEYEMMCKDMNTTNHGIIIEFMNETENYIYQYSPEWLTTSQCINWANNEVAIYMKANPTHVFAKMTPFKLKNMFHTRVEFNKTLWEELVPLIYEFWEDVEKLRESGIQEKPKPIKEKAVSKRTLNIAEASKYKFIDDSDDEEK